jgi:predicted AlkP superfamily phosphohydrolase/phosphomutase
MDATTPESPGSAWLRYLQNLHDIQQQTLKQSQQLWNDYVETLQSARSDARSGMAEAYRTYVQDVQAAMSSSDEQSATVNAYQAYIDALQKLQAEGEQEAFHAASDPEAAAKSAETMSTLWLDPERTRRVTEAYNAYAEAANKWNTAVQERLAEANRKYVAACVEMAGEDDAAATAKAAYEHYVKGMYGAYKSSAEETQASTNEAAEKVQQAAKKRSK